MPALKSKRQEAFCREYVVDGNATKAAIRAGYAERGAGQSGFRLLKTAEIKNRIAELRQEAGEQVEFTAPDVLRRWAEIATADPNDLVSVEVAACRYCHGSDHAYQWRTEREFERAVADWKKLSDRKRAATPEPTSEGGVGYSRNLAPHPECPECDGQGEPYMRLKDTRKKSPLYAGVKETQHGVEVKMHDQMAALDSIARHLGLYDADNRIGSIDALGQALIEIANRGSAMPISGQGE
ncbi:UNVERIFIED_CONTAM: hypothetical protein BEN50_25050 [Euhalothece sp. KZN 001]